LDLLLEVFSSEPDLHLHVCGRLMYDIAFARCYHRELFDTHNIHPLGWMNLLEDDFRRISQQCAFSILPSCEEGQPGSIVASMHAGLVPIVSRECGIDLEDFGIELESCSIEDIRKAVRTASTMSVAELDKTSRQARQTAREKYSEQSFSIRFREILKTVQGMSQSEDIMRGAISK
jgi:glycosyltransferase involved in cell wall biosynthesis